MAVVSHEQPEDTYYDFQTELYTLKVIGFFVIIKKPLILRVLNIILLICVHLLYFYIIFMAGYTMVTVTGNRLVVVEAFYAVGSIFIALTFVSSKLCQTDNLNKASEMLRAGLFHYENLQDECNDLRRDAVKRIRLYIALFFLDFFCLFSFFAFKPLAALFTNDEEPIDSEVSPFLPFPVIVPFDISSTSGYLCAYFSEVLALVFLYISFPLIEDMYMSGTIQIAVEYDVLRHSLYNLEKRAYMKFQKTNPAFKNWPLESLYELKEFQKCLDFCLIENIKHHQAIVRFLGYISPYFEWANFFAILMVSLLVASACIMFLENPKSQFTVIKEVGSFFPMCLFGQFIHDSSSDVKRALYSTPWYHCSDKFKTSIKIFMTNVEKPVFLKAKFVNITLSLETFADSVSLAYKVMNAIR